MSTAPAMLQVRIKPLPPGVARLARELVEVGLYLTYFAALLFTYVRFFPDVFASEGYVEAFSPLRAALVLPLIMVLVAAVQRTPMATQLLLHLGLMLVIIPMFVLYAGEGKSEGYLAIGVVSFLVIVGVVRLVRMRPTRLLRFSSSTTMRSLLLLIFFIIAAMGALGGFSHFNLDISRVYDFREEAAESLPGVFAYLVPAATKVFIPFGLILALQHRSLSGVMAIGVAVVLFFGLAAHKAILAYPLLVVCLYAVAGSRWCASLFVLGLTMLVSVSALLLSSTEHPAAVFFASLAVRRGLILPAELTSTYLTWFLENPYVWWAESKLSLGALQSPYSVRIVHLIGLEFSGSLDMGANVGWIGSGYANAGPVGVLLYALGIGLLIALLSAFANTLDARIVVAANAPLVVTVLYASDFVTSLLTHGILVSLVVLSSVKPFGQKAPPS
jgi:hypothetical protein